MRVETVKDIIFNIFENNEIGVERLKVLDKFTTDEAWDLTNDIVAAIPNNPDMVLEDVKQRVLLCLNTEEVTELVNREIKSILRLMLLEQDNKEKSLLLIFYLMYRMKIKYNNSFTEDFKQVGEYFSSYVIHTPQDLEVEVEENSIIAQTRQLNSCYIRVSGTQLIPTIHTIQFKQFL